MASPPAAPNRLAAIVIAAALLLPAGLRAAVPVPGDADWSDAFGWPGVTGSIFAATWYHGDLVVAGEFNEIGGTEARLIARWDGRAWQSIGGGLVQTDVSKRGLVTDLAIYNGELVVTGSFDYAGFLPASNIASWDGSSWKPLGDGLDRGGQALLVDQGRLIVAGEFHSAGLLAAEHAAAWDGQGWSPLGSGLDGSAFALAAYHGAIVAGGTFSQAGGVAAANVARWDGAAWDSLGAGVTGGIGGTVRALAVRGDSLIAGGAFTLAGGQPSPYVAAWNGTQWASLGGGMDNEVHALVLRAGTLIAGGQFAHAGGSPAEGIASWDGAAWSALPSRTGRTGASTIPTAILALAASDTTLVVGGHFDMTPDVLAVGLARWDGHGWFAYGGGLSDQYYLAWVSSFADYAGQLVVGGRLAHYQNTLLPSADLRTWDGTNMGALEWNVTADVTPEISALAVYHGDLIAGGTFTAIGGVSASHIARWDGVAWHAVGDGFDGSVDALYVFGDDLVAGGTFTSSGKFPAGHIARWDGVLWTELGGGTDAGVDAITAYGGQLVAAGLFVEAGGVSARRVARWDGSAWHALGDGVDNWVRALAVYDGRLVAAGYFQNAGGLAAAHIAAWNGSAWSPLGDGVDDDVSALAVFGPDLVAGGAFISAGGIPAPLVARWDGSAWASLGSGLYGSFGPFHPNVLELHVLDDHLYVGGLFTTAGGKPSYNIARWDGLPPPRPPLDFVFALQPAHPNPFNTFTGLSFTLATSTVVRGDIYDIRGRRMHEFALGQLAPGPHTLVWDGRDQHGDQVPPGIYFARFEAGGVSRVRKLAYVP